MRWEGETSSGLPADHRCATRRDSQPSCPWPSVVVLKFPEERLLRTLSRLIRSRRFLYAALTTAVTSMYSAELVTSFSEARVPEAWAEAIGNPIRSESHDPVGTFSLSKKPKVGHLPPRKAAARLLGKELSRMQAVLALDGASEVPDIIFSKKYFHVVLPNGQFAGTASSAEKVADRRREYLVRVRSNVRQSGRRGQGEVLVPTSVYGVVLHFAVVLIDEEPMAFAYIECVKSSVDRDRVSGLPKKRRQTDCFPSLGDGMRYVNAMSFDAVVGTLFVRGRHVILYSREVFSTKITSFSPSRVSSNFPSCFM